MGFFSPRVPIRFIVYYCLICSTNGLNLRRVKSISPFYHYSLVSSSRQSYMSQTRDHPGKNLGAAGLGGGGL